MGLSFQKSETLCMGKNGLSLSMQGELPRAARQAEWDRGNPGCGSSMEMMLILWVRIEHREDKTSEVSGVFLKIWQSLCRGSTHSLMGSSWRKHCWDILPQTKVLQEDVGSPEAVLQWRSELRVSCWTRSLWTSHAPSAARCARGDWWRLLLCPAAQVIANLQLPVLQSCAYYRP